MEWWWRESTSGVGGIVTDCRVHRDVAGASIICTI